MPKLNNNQGFTIVELMIALSILSIILLMSTIIIINIGTLYSKGVNAANLQNTSRTITADLSANLQFSGNVPYACGLNHPNGGIAPSFDNSTACSSTIASAPPTAPGPNTIYVFCVGTTRYTYILDQKEGTDQQPRAGWPASTPHVLWRDTISPHASCDPLGITTEQVQKDGNSTDVPAGTNLSGGYEMVPDNMRLTRFEIYQDTPSSGFYHINVWLAYGDSDLVNTQPLTSNSTTPGFSNCSGSTGTQFCSISQISTSVTGRLY